MFSSSHIVAIRKEKGFSQEVLAERSGISLRTIQRVERGETIPRGHTLLALATALEVAIEDFQPAPVPTQGQAPASSPPELRSDPQFLQILNLSALSFLLFPLLNILFPVVLWRARKRTVQDVGEVGRRVVGFQILWQVGSVCLYLLAVAVHLVGGISAKSTLPVSLLSILFTTYAVNVGAICYYAFRLRQGHLDIYPVRL
ncbi:helix-turn-helix domain-containing protein [Hymenobacter sp. HDW8]|uniref:helix-turn-helix domain-containing protein n=1 Tax=Hymenobacter sp. HDW8 TaxID=2714932 RepID=UPI00140989CE|nr:helix-turn-helix domain-containing protein [Hymenobacter sp. HDW8]QIL74741.1 helix-turn-helix domain-containing protein [Hymenobacter sp. HDW8]